RIVEHMKNAPHPIILCGTDHVRLQLLWRDQHSDIMDQYLTEGGRSIPKLIALRSSNLEELGTWGPRPKPVQKEMLRIKEEYKNAPKKEMIEVLHKGMHKWYAEDKGQTLQEEFLSLLEEWTQKLEASPSP
ncbi:MAG: thioredoxin family protein, partial [Flavobacteriales bacterium]